MTTPPNAQVGDLLSQLLGANPVAGVSKAADQFRKGVGEFITGVESFGTTMASLRDVATRLQGLLDVVEGPVRALVPQVTRTVEAADALIAKLSSSGITGLPDEVGDLVSLLRDVAGRLAPLGQLAEAAGGMFGLRGLAGLAGAAGAAGAAATSSTPKTGSTTAAPTAAAPKAPAPKAAAPRKSAPKKAPPAAGETPSQP